MSALYQQVNLYQPIFRKQRQLFSAVTMAQAAAVVALALLAVYLYGVLQVTALEAEVAQLQSLEQAHMEQLASIEPTLGSGRRAELDQEVEQLNATLRDRQRLIAVLENEPLGTTEGFSSYLAALGRRHPPQIWLTDLAINGSTRALELSGRSARAGLVPEYLRSLSREPALAGQRFDRLEIGRAEDDEVTFRATSAAAAAPEDEAQARAAE